MTDSQTSDRRDSRREPLDGEVVVQVDAQALRGRGQNISCSGLSLVALDDLEVSVSLPDGKVVRGRIVRLNQLGNGAGAGLAIRFVDV